MRLEHRGGMSSDGKTGDGAGILIDIPHIFFKKNCKFSLPDFRKYAVGMFFLPPKENQYFYCKKIFEQNIKKQNLEILGWRKVPVNSEVLGSIAKSSEPIMEQVFIKKPKEITENIFQSQIIRCPQNHRTQHKKF